MLKILYSVDIQMTVLITDRLNTRVNRIEIKNGSQRILPVNKLLKN